jgi:hypothetical protein
LRPHLARAVLSPVSDASDHIAFHDQFLDACAHYEPEVRVAPRLGDDELEQTRLREHQDVWVLGPQARKIGESLAPPTGLQGEPAHLRMTEPENAPSEAEAFQDLQGRRVYGVAPKVAVEIPVRLQKRDPHSPAREQEGQHRPRRSAAHDATIGLFDGAYRRLCKPVFWSDDRQWGDPF